ncbi:glucose-1-phosphate cytidylyltransferase [Candidatus Kuenenbacteria bacterium]|nr:glucose-1-phosphate cytidylyltransferase [Candidatus Kuenenbacteria bacterium]
MQVVILCGGKGTRIREETEHKPKPMIKIGGKPILWHIMKQYSHYGFNDFILCLGYKQHVIKEYFLEYAHMNSNFTVNLSQREVMTHDSHPENWKVTLVDTGENTKKGKRLTMIEPYLVGEKFMLTYGDGVSNVNINDLINFHDSQKKKVTFTGVHPISRFGTVDCDEHGNIRSWSEKKQLEAYVNGGFFVINRDALDCIDGDCEWEEEPLQKIANEGNLAMYKHNGFWHCMDTFRDYKILNKLWDDNQAQWKIW